MKKTFQLEDLECANCARKMEEAIGRLDGVAACTINFLSQKLTIEADDARFDHIMKQAAKCVKRAEPGCRIRL